MKNRILYLLIIMIPFLCDCSRRSNLIRQADILESGKTSFHISLDGLLMNLGSYCIYNPDDLQALTTYTRLLSITGYHAAAVRNAGKLMLENPGNSGYRNLYLSECILGYQRPTLTESEKFIPGIHTEGTTADTMRIMDSIFVLDERIRDYPSSADLYAKRGQQYFFLEEMDAAIWDFDKSIQLDPCNTVSLFNKSFALFRTRNDQNAMEFFVRYEQCIASQRKKPYSGAASYGTMLARLISLDSLIKASDHPAPYLFDKARLYARAMELESALASVDEAIKADDGKADFFALRAWVNNKMGRQAQALSDIERSEQLGGDRNSPLFKTIRQANSRRQ
ncbi:MAG: hypothetical protein ABSG89_08870 [Bacteroidales bacterium]|jgi:tetratricopeptide (TPR) repeat protein